MVSFGEPLQQLHHNFQRSNSSVTNFLIRKGQPRNNFVYYFCSFQTQITEITVGLTGIRTWIVREEGVHTDH